MRTVSELPERVRSVEHVTIEVRDGTRLAARVWLPESAEEPPVPGVLEYIPYRKRDMTRARDTLNHPYIAGHGYACVRVDMRGSGESEGVLTDEYLPLEQEDAVDVIAWIARRPWCNGRVGMMGLSWGGFNALQVAACQPPELGAIVTASSTDDRFSDDFHFMGGCLLSDNLSESTTMFAHLSCPPDPELVGERWRDMWLERLEKTGLWLERWLEHQRRDDYWKHASVSEDYSALQVPVLAAGGWADGYTNTVFRLMELLDVPRRALVGPWSHKYPHMGVPGPAIGFLQEVVRWFDHWLKDRETGVMEEPMLRLWMQDHVPPDARGFHEQPGRWVGARSWPSNRLEDRTFTLARAQLRPAGEETEEAPPEVIGVQSPLTLGQFAGKWASYAATPDLPPDQRAEDGGALVFDSPVLAEDVEILGRPWLFLEVSASQPVAMVAARLSDVAPDGKVRRVTFGLMNLCHRHGYDKPIEVEPGQKYRVRMRLNAVGQRFPKGHRIRLALSSSYWPLAWAPPRPARIDVTMGRSELVLPCHEPHPEDDDIEVPPAEAAPPLDKQTVKPGQGDWRVVRELAEDRTTMEIVKDEGTIYIPEIDLEITRDTREWYSSVGDDFTSPSGETRTVRRLRRKGWDAEVVTRTRMTCDERCFVVRAELDAYEDGHRIWSGNWHRRFARDHQ